MISVSPDISYSIGNRLKVTMACLYDTRIPIIKIKTRTSCIISILLCNFFLFISFRYWFYINTNFLRWCRFAIFTMIHKFKMIIICSITTGTFDWISIIFSLYRNIHFTTRITLIYFYISHNYHLLVCLSLPHNPPQSGQ